MNNLKIPKKILDKIEQNNRLVERAAKLNAEIERWYGEQLDTKQF